METTPKRKKKPAKTGDCLQLYMLFNLRSCIHVLTGPFLVCSTCGLAEELEQESKSVQKASQPKSACGSVRISINFFALQSFV